MLSCDDLPEATERPRVVGRRKPRRTRSRVVRETLLWGMIKVLIDFPFLISRRLHRRRDALTEGEREEEEGREKEVEGSIACRGRKMSLRQQLIPAAITFISPFYYPPLPLRFIEITARRPSSFPSTCGDGGFFHFFTSFSPLPSTLLHFDPVLSV